MTHLQAVTAGTPLASAVGRLLARDEWPIAPSRSTSNQAAPELTIAGIEGGALQVAAIVRRCGQACANLFISAETPEHATRFPSLVSQASRLAKQEGIRMLQCVPPMGVAKLPLAEIGFQKVTSLVTLIWHAPILRAPPAVVQLQRCRVDDEVAYVDMVQETFTGSRDFPELNQWQSAQDVVQDVPWTCRHWIVQRGERVGALMLRPTHTSELCELVYFGVRPSERGHQSGTRAVQQSQQETSRINPQGRLVAGVDVRNDPAIAIYTRLDFVVANTRPVFCLDLSSIE